MSISRWHKERHVVEVMARPPAKFSVLGNRWSAETRR